jgi:hypothetical protein
MKLSDEYKLELAEKLTSLAIQSNLIVKCGSGEDTAKQVTDFLKTIISTVDVPDN